MLWWCVQEKGDGCCFVRVREEKEEREKNVLVGFKEEKEVWLGSKRRGFEEF